MRLYHLLLTFIFIGFALSSKAQSAVPHITEGATVAPLEKDSMELQHQVESQSILKNTQTTLDSLFQDHDAIVKTLKKQSAKEWDQLMESSTQTIKELKEEEKQLRKELNKELKKSEKMLRKAAKKSKKAPAQEVQLFNYEN